eukprot:8116528-Pyramimonas_sp.AAC.1
MANQISDMTYDIQHQLEPPPHRPLLPPHPHSLPPDPPPAQIALGKILLEEWSWIFAVTWSLVTLPSPRIRAPSQPARPHSSLSVGFEAGVELWARGAIAWGRQPVSRAFASN